MEKLLIICEKSSAARNFEAALGGRTGTFEGDEYKIVSLSGHVVGFAREPYEQAYPNEAETIGKFSKVDTIPWRIDQFNFKKYTISPDTRVEKPEDGFYYKLVMNVKAGLQQGYIPVIATDMDTYGEGDLLAHEVLQFCGYEGKIYREYHESETPRAIRKALSEKKVVDITDPAYVTGYARSVCDYMTMQYTRLGTAKLREAGYKSPIIPAGPLKSNIIRIVGDQWDAINNYKPSSEFESRYKLGKLTLTSKEAPRYKTKEEWTPGNLPTHATVKLVKQVPGSTPPPKPFTLTTLQIAAEPKGLSGADVEKLSQKLYDAGIISYPRTEEFTIKPEEFEETLLYIDKVLDLLGLPKAAFSHRTPRKTHVSPDGSHGALRPTENTPFDLTALDAQYGDGASILYRLVSERFLMMFLEDTEWVRHEYATVEPDPVFKGSIKVITKEGVTDPDAEPEDIGSFADLPDLSQKAELYAHEVKSVAPRKVTEAFVMSQLLKFSIGTEATRLPTLNTLLKGKSAPFEKKSKLIHLTPYGEVGYIVAKAMYIATAEGFNEMRKLTLQSQKGVPVETIISQIYAIIEKDLRNLKQASLDVSGISIPKATPQASGTYVNGETITIYSEFWGEKLTHEELDKLFAGESITTYRPDMPNGPAYFTGKLEPETKDGRTYYKLKGTWKSDKSKTHYAGTFEGKPVEIKRTWGEYTFSELELQQLLEGNTITIQYKGRPLQGKLEYQERKLDGKNVKWLGFKSIMQEREGYVTGLFNGQERQIKSSYAGHTFTQEELDILFGGGNVTIEITNKKGERQKVSCKLGMNSFQKGKDTIRYFGVIATF